MDTACFWTKLAGVLAAFAVAVGAACAQTDADAAKAPLVTRSARPATGAAVTLVGRGNRAAEVKRDGTVTELDQSQLVFVNKGQGMTDWFSAPAPAAPPVKPPEQKDPVEELKAAARAEGEKAVEEALKEADKKSIEEMRKGQYMWFFDENGKPMTDKELDRRLATGDLSGIKAMNDDRDEWTPKSARDKKD